MFPCHHCFPTFLTFHELFFMNIEQILALRVNCVEAGFRPFTSTKLVNLGVKIPPIPPQKWKTRQEMNFWSQTEAYLFRRLFLGRLFWWSHKYIHSFQLGWDRFNVRFNLNRFRFITVGFLFLRLPVLGSQKVRDGAERA